MVRRRKLSNQTIMVLQALLSRPLDWRYGYDLTKQTGLKSGTLYPVLMRLADQGLLDSEWQDPIRPGAPARHAYRLSPAGVSAARASIAATPVAAPALAST